MRRKALHHIISRLVSELKPIAVSDFYRDGALSERATLREIKYIRDHCFHFIVMRPDPKDRRKTLVDLDDRIKRRIRELLMESPDSPKKDPDAVAETIFEFALRRPHYAVDAAPPSGGAAPEIPASSGEMPATSRDSEAIATTYEGTVGMLPDVADDEQSEGPSVERKVRVKVTSRLARKPIIEPATIAGRPRKTKKPRSSAAKKPYSGSMPDRHLDYFEALADECLHPRYYGMTGYWRDFEFSHQYAIFLEKHGFAARTNSLIRECRSHELFQKSRNRRHYHKARLRADLNGALYEDYLEALFDHYEKIEDPKVGNYRFPMPRLLYSEHAAEIFNYYYRTVLIKTGIRFKWDGADFDLDPAKYTGTEKQNRYYTEMLKDIVRLAHSCGRSVNAEIDTAIRDNLMAVGFAENSKFNFACPNYRFPDFEEE